MSKYAIIKIKGHQYKIEEGDELLVDKLKEKEKPEADVLLIKDKKIKIGTPYIKGASVKFKILEEEEKGKKIHVQTFKAKSRYRRKLGFRPSFTRLKVEKITS